MFFDVRTCRRRRRGQTPYYYYTNFILYKYVYIYIYLTNTILLLYYFYTTSILHLSVKYYLYYSLQFFTYDWPRSSCSDQPDAHAWPGGWITIPGMEGKSLRFHRNHKKKLGLLSCCSNRSHDFEIWSAIWSWWHRQYTDYHAQQSIAWEYSNSPSQPSPPPTCKAEHGGRPASKGRSQPSTLPRQPPVAPTQVGHTKSSQLETTVSWRVSH